jgi:hypothetical protein
MGVLFATSGIMPDFYQSPTEVTVKWGIAMALAVMCVGLAVVPWAFQRKPPSTSKLVLLIFACVGCILWGVQVSIDDWREFGEARRQSRRNLKNIALGALCYSDKENHAFPAAASFSADGKPLHGWETAILPFIDGEDLYKQIDMAAAWNDERNAVPMKQEVTLLMHPLVGERRFDGYALSHYAGNIRVIGTKPMKIADITDGTSNTLLFGEVAHDYRPWGEPMNCRDPGKGLMVADGFATPRGDHVQFAFADGTVRAFHRSVSPEILKALATPNGGESVDPDDVHK